MTRPSELIFLPSEPDQSVTITAQVRQVQGRPMLVLPMRAPVGASRGQRVRAAIGNRPARTRVALVIGGQLALRPQPDDDLSGSTVPVTVSRARSRRTRRLPADLATALASACADINGMAAHDIDQMVLMVGESATPAVRRARIDAAVAAVLARNHHDG